jgi:precorrin-4/cobalt-precorrin-4 C11-methyltransferase
MNKGTGARSADMNGGKVWFVGAGPGDPSLITVKGRELLERAGAVLYAGSLVSPELLRHAPEGCEIADSKGMTLGEITAWLISRARAHECVLRLQTGDPSLYGALVEMARPLDAAGIEWEAVPGVSSAMAAMAAAGESLTLPEVTQTVILTRTAGRTPVPEGEELAALAAHRASLCLFLSIGLARKVTSELTEAGWPPDSPVLVVRKASWPQEEKILRTSIRRLHDDCRAAGIRSQAMIVISPALGAREWPGLKKSKLYDADFSHRFRRGRTGTERNAGRTAELNADKRKAESK